MKINLEITEQKSVRVDAYNEVGENIGYAKIEITPHGVFFEDLKVTKRFRGCGVGKTLANEVFKKFPGPGFLKVEPYDDCPLTLNQLVSFYQKWGFSEPDVNGYMSK